MTNGEFPSVAAPIHPLQEIDFTSDDLPSMIYEKFLGVLRLNFDEAVQHSTSKPFHLKPAIPGAVAFRFRGVAESSPSLFLKPEMQQALMRKRIIMARNRVAYGLLAVLLVFSVGCLRIHSNLTEKQPMKMYRVKEPLQISGPEDEGYYFLPAGTVLYFEDSMAEGHSLYWVPFYHKGKIDWEDVPLEPKHQGRLIIPLWLNNLDAGQMKDLFSHFPLTKAGVKAAIKANLLTRDDLAEIMRSIPE